MATLSRESLHVSVWDPVATSMNFLNEVADRFPDAISLAAGRPWDGFHDPADLPRYLRVFQDHLAASGMPPDRVGSLLMQYGRTNGVLGELIARQLANDEGISVRPEAIAVTSGCQEAMVIALRGLCARPGDVLLAVEPWYVGITGAARLLGIDVVPVPEGPGGLDPAAVAATARAVRAGGRTPKALYVVPNFSNPSGRSLSPEARLGLLDVTEAEDLIVLEDDPYGLFGLGDEPRPSLKALDRRSRVIYLGSFAKSCFPGARVGFLVADQPVLARDGRRTLLAEELSAVKSMLTVNTSPVAQAVIGGLLLESGCSLRAASRDKSAFYRRNLRTLLRALEEHFPDTAGRRVRWTVPSGGFFVVLEVPVPADEKLLELSAERYGVLWTPMRFFYADGGTHALRLSSSALEPGRIGEGVARLARLLADHS
ncbi:PLP-dependent aminotransferase family protein [Streptomyces sp. NBC_01754]|uniref:aminotransferase-like domain-containing protein n=1 Tax=Streptomyces sp. NBC_01754 TaxID=2975930 RepID=UPI002DDB8F53|nr:PLP-dependent aminotransferase family protein [Streptomyces sp. NBC_01754]WSC90938.1 PLP-dependent aminotransferase family protein [Streptomyces sp. NBC_01754]WSC96568.1 PLP-dependent aminotransferase family protein [Streptomyces sp. NBC_01754]